MDSDTLKDRLSTNSPFIFKKKIEKEEHWAFKGDEIILNEKVIGLYSVEEQEDYFKVRCFTSGRYDMNEPILVMIDYKDKPILLTGPDRNVLISETHELDNLLKLIPRKQFLADEKAEL